jgi:hypothetical protein
MLARQPFLHAQAMAELRRKDHAMRSAATYDGIGDWYEQEFLGSLSRLVRIRSESTTRCGHCTVATADRVSTLGAAPVSGRN